MLYVNPQAEAGFRSRDLSPGAKGRETQALKEFEQLFLFQMLKEMRQTVPEGGLYENNSQKAYFDEMMDDFNAGEMAKSGQLGVAAQMAQQLHARDKKPLPSSSSAQVLPATTGLPVVKTSKGIPVPEDAATGFQVNLNKSGLPLKPLHQGGIAVSRAHEKYRSNE